jgi:hypothetical protein
VVVTRGICVGMVSIAGEWGGLSSK